jgi:hypothetical protein
LLPASSIRIVIEVGRRVVVKAKGSSAVVLAMGIATAAVKAASRIGKFAHRTVKTIL